MGTPYFSNFHKGLEVFIAQIIQDFMHAMNLQGLSITQIHAMMYIYHAGECHVSDIGALADVSNAAASQLVERLVVQDLVERREDPANRRTKLLRLTEKGKGLIQGSIPSDHFLETMASLTSDQHETVRDAFSILAQATQQAQSSNKPKDDPHA